MLYRTLSIFWQFLGEEGFPLQFLVFSSIMSLKFDMIRWYNKCYVKIQVCRKPKTRSENIHKESLTE